jgi:hypothetical protein
MIFIEILPNLWIGNSETLKHKDRLNIDYIINCSKDLHFLGNCNNYKSGIKNNLEKYEIIKMYEYLIETSDFINTKLLTNKSVLVTCNTGNQQSVTIIASYIIKYGKMTLNNVIKSLRTKHKTAFFPSIDYKNSLEMVETNFLSN